MTGTRTSPTLEELFGEPPGDFWPVPLWWWSGEPLAPGRLRWQLDRLAAGGVRGVVVMNLAPVGPSFGCPTDEPPWFSERWWELFVLTCEHARALGMRVWFYDQLGFSAANLQGQVVDQHPECAGEVIERVVVDSDEACELSAPPGSRVVAAAALPLEPGGGLAGPPLGLDVDGPIARYGGGRPARVMLAYARRKGFDYLSPTACERLIDVVHGEFERRVPALLGDVIAGSFQDELPALGTWTTGFLDAFREQHGYELGPLVAALWEDWGPESAAVRVDYHTTRAALTQVAFFRPLARWHERHGMLHGCDQQSPARSGHPIESAQLYADYTATHRWFTAPGSDHHGDAKIHSSLAHLHGGRRVWLEGFHSSGWGGTLEETFDWLLPWIRAGVTLYNPHAVYYSTRRGWFEFAPPSTCWRQPYWRHYPIFARTVARLCAVLAQGAHRCDVAVLFPASTVHAHLPVDQPVILEGLPGGRRPPTVTRTPARDAQDAYLALVGRMRWFDPQPGVLDRDRRDFDVVDEPTLATAKVADGTLTTADESYRAIVLPATTVLDLGTAASLMRFADDGGLVVTVGSAPQTAAGRAGDHEVVRALAAHPAVHHVASPDEVPAALGALDRMVDAPVPTLLRRIGDRHVLFVPAAHPGATGYLATASSVVLDYSFDPARYARSMVVRTRGFPGRPSLWDPVTGETSPLATRDLSGGITDVEIRFDHGPGALVVFDPDTPPAAPPAPAPSRPRPTRTVPIEGPWTSQLIPTMDNRHEDFAPSSAPAPGAATLAVWSMDHRYDPDDRGVVEHWQHDRGRESWTRVRATFGPHGLFTGPAPLTDLPEPLPDAQAMGGEADVTGWRDVVYSDSRGIDRDLAHYESLGPKGYVPEEIFALPLPGDGEGVQLRSLVRADQAGEAHLAVAAPAHKQAWWNGQRLPSDPGGYLFLTPVWLEEGPNLLEIRLSRPEASTVPLPPVLRRMRGHWALVTDPDRYRRPEWIIAGDPPQPGSTVVARGELRLHQARPDARLLVATAGVATLTINGHRVAHLADRGYYEAMAGDMPAAFVHPIGHLLRPDGNIVEVALNDDGRERPLLVDVDLGEGATWSTSRSWTIERDGEPVPLRLSPCQWFDPWVWCIRPRPHPLPRAEWLDGETGRSAVVPVRASPDAATETVDWFRFDLPPGAGRLRLPVHGEARAWVDGEPVHADDDGWFVLAPGGPKRSCIVRTVAPPGVRGGAVWRDAPPVEVGTGQVELGDWQDQGLRGWSGGVAYRRTFELTAAQAAGSVTLDLGAVRGTVEVLVSGHLVGARVFSPWTFDLTGQVTAGPNELEVRVFGTLGPYFHETSPTSSVFRSQRRTGLFGPVRLLIADG